MKKPTELNRMLRAFVLLSCIGLCVLLVVLGSIRAKNNSEYALNGKTPEYVSAPWIF